MKRPTPPTRPIVYAYAATADVDHELARLAMTDGLDAVKDPLDRGRLETAARVIGITLPKAKRAGCPEPTRLSDEEHA